MAGRGGAPRGLRVDPAGLERPALGRAPLLLPPRARRRGVPLRQEGLGSGAMGVGCFVSVGRSLEQAVDRVRLAEELRFESVFVTHINARDSLTVLAHYAGRTERIRLGTG